MTDDASTPDPQGPGPSAPQHRAPPKDERPRSPLAVWALVLTVVLGVGAALALFLWAALLPAALFALFALTRIKPQRTRGQGMALIALCLALLIGSCHFLVAKAARDTALYLGRGAMAALAAEDASKIEQWLRPEALEEGAADRIRLRYAAVLEAVGPYQREVSGGSLWLGAFPFKLPPSGVEEMKELGGGIGDAWAMHPDAFWVEARFRDAVVHVELLVSSDYDSLAEATQKAQETAPASVLLDIRFFLAEPKE